MKNKNVKWIYYILLMVLLPNFVLACTDSPILWYWGAFESFIAWFVLPIVLLLILFKFYKKKNIKTGVIVLFLILPIVALYLIDTAMDARAMEKIKSEEKKYLQSEEHKKCIEGMNNPDKTDYLRFCQLPQPLGGCGNQNNLSNIIIEKILNLGN